MFVCQEEEETRKSAEDAEMSGWTNSSNQDIPVLSELKSLAEDNPPNSVKLEETSEKKPHHLPPLEPLSVSELHAQSLIKLKTDEK